MVCPFGHVRLVLSFGPDYTFGTRQGRRVGFSLGSGLFQGDPCQDGLGQKDIADVPEGL